MRRALVILPVLAALLVVLVVLTRPSAPAPAPGPAQPPEPLTGTARPRALAVLGRWDAARARAWAHDDLPALRALYVPGSRTGRRDVAMLRRWRARGLAVRRMRQQVFDVQVLHAGPRRLVVRVTDRLVDAVAVGGRHPRALPQDSPSTTRLVLRKDAGRWREVEAYPAR